MIRYPQYLGQDGKTDLSHTYFNPIWQDLDGRLDKLEQLNVSWSSAVAELRDFGLARLDETLAPLIESLQTNVSEAQETVAEILEELENLDLQGQIDTALAAQTAALEAALDVQEAALDAQSADVAAALASQSSAVDADLTALQSLVTDALADQTSAMDAAMAALIADVDAAIAGLDALDGADLTDGSVAFAKLPTIATNKMLGRFTAGTGVIEVFDCTAAGRALLDDADATAQRTTLGLGTMATQAAGGVAITGGTIAGATITGGSISGITDLAVADGGTGVSSFNAYGTIIGGTTSTGALQSVAPGTAGYVWTSNGAGAAPSFQAPSAPNKTMWLRPTDFVIGTGATAPALLSLAGAVMNLPYFVFADAADVHIWTTFLVPTNWTGSTFSIQMYWSISANNTSDIEFEINARGYTANDELDQAWSATVVIQTDTVASDGDELEISPAGVITPTGTLSPGDMVGLHIKRESTSDALSISAQFFGAKITYT